LIEHCGHVDQLPKKVDNLRIADDTIVIWTTDNGAEVSTWLDGVAAIINWSSWGNGSTVTGIIDLKRAIRKAMFMFF